MHELKKSKIKSPHHACQPPIPPQTPKIPTDRTTKRLHDPSPSSNISILSPSPQPTTHLVPHNPTANPKPNFSSLPIPSKLLPTLNREFVAFRTSRVNIEMAPYCINLELEKKEALMRCRSCFGRPLTDQANNAGNGWKELSSAVALRRLG